MYGFKLGRGYCHSQPLLQWHLSGFRVGVPASRKGIQENPHQSPVRRCVGHTVRYQHYQVENVCPLRICLAKDVQLCEQPVRKRTRTIQDGSYPLRHLLWTRHLPKDNLLRTQESEFEFLDDKVGLWSRTMITCFPVSHLQQCGMGYSHGGSCTVTPRSGNRLFIDSHAFIMLASE